MTSKAPTNIEGGTRRESVKSPHRMLILKLLLVHLPIMKNVLYAKNVHTLMQKIWCSKASYLICYIPQYLRCNSIFFIDAACTQQFEKYPFMESIKEKKPSSFASRKKKKTKYNKTLIGLHLAAVGRACILLPFAVARARTGMTPSEGSSSHYLSAPGSSHHDLWSRFPVATTASSSYNSS